MTLNGHFMVNFHCYEQRFQNLEPIYRIFLLYLATSRLSRDVRKRTVISRIFGIRGSEDVASERTENRRFGQPHYIVLDLLSGELPRI